MVLVSTVLASFAFLAVAFAANDVATIPDGKHFPLGPGADASSLTVSCFQASIADELVLDLRAGVEYVRVHYHFR